MQTAQLSAAALIFSRLIWGLVSKVCNIRWGLVSRVCDLRSQICSHLLGHDLAEHTDKVGHACSQDTCKYVCPIRLLQKCMPMLSMLPSKLPTPVLVATSNRGSAIEPISAALVGRPLANKDR